MVTGTSGSGGGLGGLVHEISSFLGGLLGGNPSSELFSIGARDLLSVIQTWVSDGAVWLLDQVGAVLNSTTEANLNSSWFGARFSLMAELTASVMLPMILCAVIQCVYRQNAAALMRIFLVNLPLAVLLTGVAVELVRIAMAVTDAMSAEFLAAAGEDTREIVSTLTVLAGPGAAGVPGFAMFIAELLIAGTAFTLWLELVVRASAITAAALFLPLVLGALVWPAISHWARRLADTLAALVLSKLVIAAVISLAVGAVAGGLDGSGSVSSRFGDLVVGVALLLLATFSPFVLLRLIPVLEAGAASHLEGARHRFAPAAQSAIRPAASAGQSIAARFAKGESTDDVGEQPSGPSPARLAAMGIATGGIGVEVPWLAADSPLVRESARKLKPEMKPEMKPEAKAPKSERAGE